MKFAINFLLLFSITFFCNPAIANTPLPLEVYSSLPNISMMRVSPSGNKIAYRLAQQDKDMLAVVNIESKKFLGAIEISQIDPDDLYFVDEQRVILIASQNKRLWGFRGRHDLSTAFLFDPAANEVRQLLIPGKGIYRGQTGLGQIVGISQDQKYAYMPAFVDDNTGLRYDLLRVDLDKKSTPKRFRRGKTDTVDYFVDENDNVLARENYNNNTNLHTIEALKEGKWVKIFQEETEYRSKGFVGVTPDNKSLVALIWDGSGRSSYYTMSLKNGEITGPLFSRDDADIEYVLTDKYRKVYGVQYSGFKPSYAFFDKKLDSTVKAILGSMPSNTFIISDYSPDFEHMLFYVEGEGLSGKFFLYSNGNFQLLASAREKIVPEMVNPVEAIMVTARDGLQIPTLITTPVNHKDHKNLPAIMLPHGGPEAYDTMAFDWLAQYFASRGYLVIQPQFRGSEGFGAKHILAGRGEWGRKMQDDLTDALKHMVELGAVDPRKVCIVGNSYGGYAALAGVAFTPDLYQCAVSINGVSDVARMLKTDKRNYGKNHWVVSYWEDVIADGDANSDLLEQISPINFAKNIKAPVLLVHGEHDTVVPYKQSRRMFNELKDEGKQVKLVELENEGHHLNSGASRLKMLQAIDAFVNKHI